MLIPDQVPVRWDILITQLSVRPSLPPLNLGLSPPRPPGLTVVRRGVFLEENPGAATRRMTNACWLGKNNIGLTLKIFFWRKSKKEIHNKATFLPSRKLGFSCKINRKPKVMVTNDLK